MASQTSSEAHLTGRPESSRAVVSDLARAQELLGRHNHTEDDHYHLDQHGQQQRSNHSPEHFFAGNQHLSSTFKNQERLPFGKPRRVEAEELSWSGRFS